MKYKYVKVTKEHYAFARELIKSGLVDAWRAASPQGMNAPGWDEYVKVRNAIGCVTRQNRIKKAREMATHSKAEWETVVALCGNVCTRCGAVGRLHKDHIVPIYQGGSNGVDNLQPLCSKCNLSKSGESEDHRPELARYAALCMARKRANAKRWEMHRARKAETHLDIVTHHGDTFAVASKADCGVIEVSVRKLRGA